MGPKIQPWTCAQCKIKVKGTQNCCGNCGQPWYQQTYSGEYQDEWRRTDAGQNNWKQRQQRRQSPRPGTPRGGRQTEAQDGGGQRPTPKGAGKGKQPELADRLAGAVPQAPTAAALPPAPRPGEQPSTSGEGEAQRTLDALLSALSRQDRGQLPPEVQRLMGETQASDAKRLTRALHQQTTKQGTARKDLAKLRDDRLAFMSQWQQYLEKLVELLTTQLTARDATLAEYNAREQALVIQVNDAVSEISRLQTLMADDAQEVDKSAQSEEPTSATTLPATEVLSSLQGALTSTRQFVVQMSGKRRAIEPPQVLDSDDELMKDSQIADAARDAQQKARAALAAAGYGPGDLSAPSTQSVPG